ncbi:hypothetical protein BpHYR1_052971 [Brachionus plicatilis]|uniref:Uncharacterized protein n=1 Tax=Brachionus plicatilis TaxID=10195 RepID=A0A3M7RVK9_BRAPC|nr:hypothetical protein BpHYR1_052971 [Brachionus plicatilis]
MPDENELDSSGSCECSVSSKLIRSFLGICFPFCLESSNGGLDDVDEHGDDETVRACEFSTCDKSAWVESSIDSNRAPRCPEESHCLHSIVDLRKIKILCQQPHFLNILKGLSNKLYYKLMAVILKTESKLLKITEISDWFKIMNPHNYLGFGVDDVDGAAFDCNQCFGLARKNSNLRTTGCSH